MALFEQSYTPPGVETIENFVAASASLVGTGPITVLIGEGPETFAISNVEMHRGSSATSDDQVVGENLSAQVDGQTRTYQLSHFPVVTGNGTGTITNDPTVVQMSAGGTPLTLLSLNGATGVVTAQAIVPVGTNVTAQYYFKRTDTRVTNEDLSGQIPAFASLTVSPSLVLSLSQPGSLGNLITFALTEAAAGGNHGVSDAFAVTGAGTDAISIELRKTDDTLRTYEDIANLISAGISTQDGGYLTVEYAADVAAAVFAETAFSNGSGPSTNTTFIVAQAPIVDGTNGGIVTTNPSDVTVQVGGINVGVLSVNGVTGAVTLANAVPYGSALTISYYTNTYQDTGDTIPDAGISAITAVGLAPNRSDFIQGVDFVLGPNGTINWGASVSTAADKSTAGYTPLDASVINTTLADEQVFLRPLTGVSNSRNSSFTLPDVPVDGTGLNRATSNPALVQVYVGTNPISALQAGLVKVSSLSGASGTVSLYNAPPANSNVYASYFRSTLNDHQFTLAVATAGAPGQGTVTITDELGQIAPSIALSAHAVANENFATTGVVWPNNFPDATADLGAADEVITLTFQDDGLVSVVTPSSQASATISDTGSVPRIRFQATTPGVAADAVTITLLGGTPGAADASAIAVEGTAVTVATVMADNVTTRSWQQIVALFATYPPTVPGAGVILCSGVTGADLTPQSDAVAATHLAGGVNQVTVPYSQRYTVTSSRTLAQAQADQLGRTGGSTTPSTPNWAAGNPAAGIGYSGYLGQTYVDPATGVKFTLVDPHSALGYGYVQLPSPSYSFAPGDTLTLTISSETAHVTGAAPTIAIPGLRVQVVTTLGMHVGDTAVVSTFNKAGNEPAVGDYYYISYVKAKQASDYGLTLWDSDTAFYAAGGQPSVTNRLALGVYLFVENGGGQFATIQVPAQAGLGIASDQSFIDAIQTLAKRLPGSSSKVNVVVPLSTSATVQQSLSQFLSKQAGPRYKGEATSFIGMNQFATGNSFRALASAIANQRVVLMGLPSLGVMLQSSPTSPAVEYAVTGEFLAAALAGLMCNSTNDVATTLTGQIVTGFSRALVTFDDPTMDLMAASGVCCFTEVSGGLEVRHYKTTDPSNALTSEPYVTTTADRISQIFRSQLNQFKGRKEVPGITTTITQVCNSLMSGFVNTLISAYNPATVTQDPNDPTTIDVTISYRPMFSLLYINVTFTVNLG
jgi:hypothetical protein